MDLVFPKEFSKQARANVVAARIKAGQAYNDATPPFIPLARVVKYILTVFSAFSHEACELGRLGVWGVDRVEEVALGCLNMLARSAFYRFETPHFSVPIMTGTIGEILPKYQRVLELEPEWKAYETELLAVAEIQRASNFRVVEQPNATLRDKKTRHFKDPNPELLKDKDTVNRKQAAIALGITERTLDRIVADKLLHPIGPFRSKRYKTKELLRILNQKN